MRMIIRGGHHLRGEVGIMGAKNAVGPLIAATLLVKGATIFTNVPRLTDVLTLLEIMESMGARVEWLESHTLRIDTSEVDPSRVNRKKMKSMRYSILLLGPLLGRFREVVVPEPGGCNIGNRPIDFHLYALSALGASVTTEVDGSLCLNAKSLRGAYVVMPNFSVTATENLIMAACCAQGKTAIRIAAAEPHVQELCRFLKSAGAKIKGIGTHELEVIGAGELRAPKKPWKVVPDTIEIGTFAVAAALTRGDVRLSPVVPEHLDAVLSLLTRIGVQVQTSKKEIRVQGAGTRLEAFRLQTNPYPGFPTDLQAPFGLLATQCQGTSLIHDPVYESRLGYISELVKMGANAVIADPHRVIISGPAPLHGTEIRSLDLRAGATMVLAGLIADGETIIHDAEMVYRGYEGLDERLCSLGADITCLRDE